MVTFTRKLVGSSLFLTDELREAAYVDVDQYARESLERQMRDSGAVEPYNIEARREVMEYERPREWWQRLLRRPAEIVTIPGVRYVASGWTWERVT
jgi:hypothetical protein